MRALVIADCHGRPELIRNALNHAQYNPKSDRLIFAGDFLDIGFHPKECLQILRKNKAEMLWGNHELAIVLGHRISPQNPESWQLLKDLKKIEFKVAAEHEGVLITHAGVGDHYSNVKLNYLNSFTLSDLWWNDSPVWFRPGWVKLGIIQIAGHTPPESVRMHSPNIDLFDLKDWSRIRATALLRDDHTCQDCHKQYKIKFIRCYRPDYLPTLTEVEQNPILVRHRMEIGGHKFVWKLVKEDIPMEVHHIVPISEDGPEFDLNNLVTLCEKCHDIRHAGKPKPTKEEIKSTEVYNIRKMHRCFDQFAEGQ